MPEDFASVSVPDWMDRPKGMNGSSNAIARSCQKRHPMDMGFEDQCGLWWRRAHPCSKVQPLATSLLVEIGSIDAPMIQTLAIHQDTATCEILCNRSSLLGNPFCMKKNEHLRNAVCDAFKEYFRIVVETQPTKLMQVGSLHSLASKIAPKYGLDPHIHFSREWRQLFGSQQAVDLKAAFDALVTLVRTYSERGEKIRLLCHCVPRRCHCEDLVAFMQSSSNHKQAHGYKRSVYCNDGGTKHNRRLNSHNRTLRRYLSAYCRSEFRRTTEF